MAHVNAFFNTHFVFQTPNEQNSATEQSTHSNHDDPKTPECSHYLVTPCFSRYFALHRRR
ncbi:Uncharacterised protein [Vibrio cholerae]|nr:Uncharacterised protein [Vibrio cholerae]CSD20795.1 Uncharacterised protein [Vibrio cholerae]